MLLPWRQFFYTPSSKVYAVKIQNTEIIDFNDVEFGISHNLQPKPYA